MIHPGCHLEKQKKKNEEKKKMKKKVLFSDLPLLAML